jgi:hypothetical protein|tara:strand:+ start:712 stop:1089 length:378 start_codon:yes stop_codon:yes gene_type:complete
LGLGEDGLTLGVEEVVGSLPGDRGAGSLDDFGGITFPVIALEVVEVVAAIDASESPIEASLVFVVSRAKFSEGALAIGSNNRVEIGSRSGASDLGENGGVTAVNVNQSSLGVVVEAQVFCGYKGS